MVLAPGGCVFLRPDDADYFQQMQEVFSRASQFVACETPKALEQIQTEFEMDFQKRGIVPLYAAYQLEALRGEQAEPIADSR